MSRATSQRRKRGNLSRDLIVDAAIELIDAEGLHRLTMRRLAEKLECGTMTLYGHVWDRDDLLFAVVERVMMEIDFHYEPGDTWADVVRRAFEAYRGMARRHPTAFSLVAAFPVDRPPVIDHLARAAATLQMAGISLDSAYALLGIADAFATGLFITDIATNAPVSATPSRGSATPEDDPHIRRFHDYAGDDLWRQGVDTIIAGAQKVLGLPPAT